MMSANRHDSNVRSSSTRQAQHPQQPIHTRARSVHFPAEPVARDVQREMELELQRWVEPALATVFVFGSSARGAVSVRRCTQAETEKTVVLKTVAMTLPPNRSCATNATNINTTATSFRFGGQGFTSTDLSTDPSSNLSGNLLNSMPSSRDVTTWSQAQLLPGISVALFNQVGKNMLHIASVVDVFTLASMLRQSKEKEEEQSGELVRLPKLTKSDMEERGWTMADAMAYTTATAGASSAPASARGRRGDGSSANSSPRKNSVSSPPPPPPHPTVFLYARDYVENYQSLTTFLEDRWGRDLLPLTVMPRWVHYGPDSSSRALHNAHLKPEDVRKLEDHVTRWLSGRAKVERKKRRLIEERAAAETALHGAVIGAPVGEDRQRLTEHDAADIVWATASALDALHRSGLVHGNLKPNNVLVQPWGDTAAAQGLNSRRQVFLTDHLLPLVPDALLEPAAVLSLPGWRACETRGYACLKTHDAAVLPHMFGGGPAGAPLGDPASYTLSGCWLKAGEEGGEKLANGRGAALVIDGGVEGLSNEAYEAVLLQHLMAPENVLLVRDSEDAAEPAMAVDAAATVASGEQYRVWVNLENPTPASDVYALGVLLWVMLVGRLPPLPQYRRALRYIGSSPYEKAGAVVGVSMDHGTPIPPSYAEVLQGCVMSLYETRMNTAAGESNIGNAARNAKVEKRLRALSIFLHTDTARAHLPLVLALARVPDVQLVAMDLLVRLLHSDPKHRLTLEELRQHAFFRTYGSRRHELRRRYEEALRAANLSARHSMCAADGHALMPRQMGALAGVPRCDSRRSLERCRSEVATTMCATKAAKQGKLSEWRANSISSATELEVSKQQRGEELYASPPCPHPCSAHLFSPSPVATVTAALGPSHSHSPLAQQRISETFGQEKYEQTCILGPASPSLTRRSSSSNSAHKSGCSSVHCHPSTLSPAVVVPTASRDERSIAEAFTTPERSLPARLRTPSLPLANSNAPDVSSPPGLSRTKTLKSGRRWKTLQSTASMLSPLIGDENDDNHDADSFSLHRGSSLVRETEHRTRAVEEGTHTAAESVDKKERRERPNNMVAGDRARVVLTPKASWVSDAPTALLLSVPSRRLAPLPADASPMEADAEQVSLRFPIGPRRPAVRARPTK